MGDANRRSIPFRRPAEHPDANLDDIDLSALANQLYDIAERLRGGLSDHRRTDRHDTHFAERSPTERRQGAPRSGHSHLRHAAGLPNDTPSEYRKYARLAKQIYALRREREAIFGNAEMFGEPAWDILLDLYVAHAESKPVSVSSACIGSASPPTTGLRWLGVLADEGLIVREHDPDDQRRVLVRLSETGVKAMDAYFATAVAIA